MSATTASRARALARTFASRAASASQRPNVDVPGVYEIRTRIIQPSRLDDYIDVTTRAKADTTRLNPGFLAAFVDDIGGNVNAVTEVSRYDDYDARDRTMRAAREDAAWRARDEATRAMTMSETTEIFLEARIATEAGGLPVNDIVRRAETESTMTTRGDGVFEWRRYQLELGYNPIPKLQELIARGLPSKLATDREKKAELVWMGFSDVGKLNQFVELWRYDDAQAHIETRVAAREATEWRATVNDIAPMVQMFDTRMMRPIGSSRVR